MSYDISPSLSDLLQSAWHSLGLSMLLQMASFHSFNGWVISIVYTYHIFLIQPSVDGHLGGFYVLATVNTAAMSTEVCVPFWFMVFSGYMPRSGIAGSFLALFIFLRNLHDGCPTGYRSEGLQDALLGFNLSARLAHRAEEDLLNFLDSQLTIKDTVRWRPPDGAWARAFLPPRRTLPAPWLASRPAPAWDFWVLWSLASQDDWLAPQPVMDSPSPTLSSGGWDGVESSNPVTTEWLLPGTSPHPWLASKSSLARYHLKFHRNQVSSPSFQWKAENRPWVPESPFLLNPDWQAWPRICIVPYLQLSCYKMDKWLHLSITQFHHS